MPTKGARRKAAKQRVPRVSRPGEDKDEQPRVTARDSADDGLPANDDLEVSRKTLPFDILQIYIWTRAAMYVIKLLMCRFSFTDGPVYEWETRCVIL